MHGVHLDIALVVVSAGSGEDDADVASEVVAIVRERVGAVAALKSVAVVDALPKTRSGKILRNVLRNIADGESYKLPGTIERAEVVDDVAKSIASIGYPKQNEPQ